MIKTLLILGFISALTSSLIAVDYLWDYAYHHLMELAFLFYLSGFYLLSKKDSIKFSKLWQTITLIIVLFPFSVLIDELFYNTLELEWNDLIRITMIITTSFLIKYNKTWINILK